MTPELETRLRQLIERLLEATHAPNFTSIREPNEAWINTSRFFRGLANASFSARKKRH
jgi:hypothetical protein